MWFLRSSIGRKVVMSISGLALVLFLIFHGAMNLTLVFSESAYNRICELLGANWYALIGSMGIALLIVIHFLFGLYLTYQNHKARGETHYSIRKVSNIVTWESENMLLLGGIVLGFLLLHLYNFWFRMQLAEITGGATAGAFDPQNGAAYVRNLFGASANSNHIVGLVYCGLYLVWLVALFLHLNHGISSAFSSLGQSNIIWYNRVRILGKLLAGLVILPFAIVIIYYLSVNIGMLIS